MTLTALQAEVVARIKANGQKRRGKFGRRSHPKSVQAAMLAHDLPMSIERAAQQWSITPRIVRLTYRRLYGATP